MSETVFEQPLDHPIEQVWGVHATPGIVTRLTPGFTRVRLLQEAGNLKSGLTRMRFPGGVVWEGKHDPGFYRPLVAASGGQPAHVDSPAQFSDVCATPGIGSAFGWRHVHSFQDVHAGGGTILRDRITTNAPGFLADQLLKGVFGYRHAQLAGDLKHLQQARGWTGESTREMTIAVTGATGAVGTQLCALLQLAGHRVIRLSRNPQPLIDEVNARPGGAAVHYRTWDPEHPAEDLLADVDAVVHLAGSSIAGRFTEEHLAKVAGSRIEPTRKLAELAARTGQVHTFVSASAVGFYGADASEPVDETAPADENSTLGRIVRDWEAATEPAVAAGLRVVQVRTGLVMAAGTALLDLLTAQAKLGGGALGSGRQFFPWIAMNDLVDIYHRALTDPMLHGPVNAVAPGIVRNREFMATLAEVGGNPLLPRSLRGTLQVPVPAAGPRLLLGEDGAAELALADQNVRPVVLADMGHEFRTPELADALRHELGKNPASALQS